jgi:hypothetical protein
MDELISDKRRDEMPQKVRVEGKNLKVQEADEHLHTVGRNALLPKVVWPDVPPSLRSRLIDYLLLLTGRRKWWASASGDSAAGSTVGTTTSASSSRPIAA